MSERVSVSSDLFWAYADEYGGPDEGRERMREVLEDNAPGESDGD